MSFLDDAFDDGSHDGSDEPTYRGLQRPVFYPSAPPLDPYTPDELTQVIPVVRGPHPDDDVESPTEQLPVVRLDAEHEALLARLRDRSAPDSPRAGHRRHRGRRRRTPSTLYRASLSAVAFTLLLVLSAAGLAGVAYTKFNGQITRVAVLQTHDPNIRDAVRQQGAENFLIIGSDTRSGANAQFGNVAGARSDTTILVHLSPDHAKATVISIPRDSWVEIPDCTQADGAIVQAHHDMFNAAFALGGPACTIATVQKLTGIAVTHFVEIDFSGFERMVDAMGRVTICSPQAVVDPNSGLRLRSGENRLDGTQALAYVRARESLGDGSDLGRIKRQQIFLGAVLRQAMHGSLISDPGRLTRFLDAATKAITVDKGTSFGDLRTLATSMQGLDPRRVTFWTAPIADPDYSPPGTSMTGKVLLDDVAGRALYDSVIEDRKPVLVKNVGGRTVLVSPAPTRTAPKPGTTSPTTKAAAAPAPKTATPTPNGNAGDRTCSL